MATKIGAGKKSWITRRKKEKALRNKLAQAGFKSWETRWANKKKAEILSTLPQKKEKGYVVKERKNKERITKHKATTYKNLGIKKGNGLFLLSKTLNDVKVINEVIPNNNIHFITAEKDEIARETIRRRNKEEKLNIELYGYCIGQVIKDSPKNSLVIGDIDLCTVFSSALPIVYNALTKDIFKVGAPLSFTFDTRDGGIRRLAIDLGLKNLDELSKQKGGLIIPVLLAYFKKIGGDKWKIIYQPEIYSDSDSGAGANMVFVMLQRVK